MGVYIKNMKMPENCGKCSFLIEEDIDFDICRHCGAGKSEYIYEKDIDGFPSDCPLVELPDHHGRLVDADALIEKYWDGNSMEITAWDLKDIKTVIEAEDGT